MRIKLALAGVLALGVACGPLPAATQIVIMVSATPAPTRLVQIKATPEPTEPHTPTARPTATPTRLAGFPVVNIGQVEAALGEHGYRRYPFALDDGLSGFTWVKESSYETIETISNGYIELQVLHEQSAAERDQHMERKLTILDSVLPDGFMQEMRRLHRSYNAEVPSTVSGQPDRSFAYQDDFNTVWAQYYTEFSEVGNYATEISLWWWQSTCPSRVPFCYYLDFPGLEFTGDSSFVFYTIAIFLPGPAGAPSDSL